MEKETERFSLPLIQNSFDLNVKMYEHVNRFACKDDLPLIPSLGKEGKLSSSLLQGEVGRGIQIIDEPIS